MLLRLVKLVIGLLLLNAAWRFGGAYWQYYQFEDAVKQAALFSGTKEPGYTQAQVLEIAKSMNVPLADNRLVVRRDENRIFVDASYSRSIEVVPGYPVPWEFKVNVSSFVTPIRPIK